MTPADVAAAEARAAEARARLNGTVHALQAQLNPNTLADRAKQRVVDGGLRAADVSIAVTERNPRIVFGALGLATLLLVRRPVARLFRRRKPRPQRAARPAYPVPTKDARS
jgi:hypothetical protein